MVFALSSAARTDKNRPDVVAVLLRSASECPSFDREEHPCLTAGDSPSHSAVSYTVGGCSESSIVHDAAVVPGRRAAHALLLSPRTWVAKKLQYRYEKSSLFTS